MLFWSEVIEYSGDLMTPPDEAKKQRALHLQSKKTIRGGENSDSDLDSD